MDPNTTTNIDPKLKDMYDRVMNTPIPPPVSTTPVQNGDLVTPPASGITSFPTSDQTQPQAQPPVLPSLNESSPLNQVSQDQQQNSNPFLTPTPPTSAAPTPPQPETQTPAVETPPTSPQPEMQPPTPIQSGPTIEMQAAIPMPAAPVAPKPISAAIVGGSAKNNSKKLMPVLITFGAIIFFAVYAIFWVKFFNLQIPFLPF